MSKCQELDLNLKNKFVTLKGCLDKAKAVQIIQKMETNRTVISLDLSNNNLKGCGKPIANMLKKNRTLTSLNLTNVSIDDDGWADIAEALNPRKGNNRTLTSLNISKNTNWGEWAAKTFTEMLKNNRILKKLDISYIDNMEPSDDGWNLLTHFLDALEHNKYLTHLTARKLESSSSRLQDLLQANNTLQVLDISDCEYQSTYEILASLKDNKGLQELYMPGCEWKGLDVPYVREEKGQAAWNDTFKNLKTLKILDLSHCGLKDKDFVILETAMKNNTSIEKLIVKENHPTPACTFCLSDLSGERAMMNLKKAKGTKFEYELKLHFSPTLKF